MTQKKQEEMVEERAVNLLDALGETSQEVADMLVVNRVKGVRCHPHQDPVAMYLRGRGIEVIFVGMRFVRISAKNGRRVDVLLSQAVKYFQEDFDSKKYPQIEV